MKMSRMFYDEECSISYYMSFRGGESASHFGNRNLIYWKPAAHRRILYLPTPGLIKALSAGTTGTTGTPGRQINRSGLPPCHLIPEPINSRSGAVFYSERSLIKNHLSAINRLLPGKWCCSLLSTCKWLEYTKMARKNFQVPLNKQRAPNVGKTLLSEIHLQH